MNLINKRIYLFGGFQEGGVLNDLYSIDLLSWNWIKIDTQGPSPSPRQGMGSIRVGKKLYIISGCDYRLQKCYPDTYILDIDSLWWSKIEDKYIIFYIALILSKQEMALQSTTIEEIYMHLVDVNYTKGVITI